MRGARPFVVLLVALKGLLVATTFLPPAIVGVFVDEVIVAGSGERLYLLLGAFVAVYVVETLLKVIEVWAANRAVHRTVFRQRMRVFRSVQRLAWVELMRRAPGELLKRVEEDTEELGDYLLQRIERIFNWCLVAVGAVVCVTVSWRLSVAGTVLTVTVWMLGLWFKRKATVRGEAFRVALGKWSAWLHESLLGWREVRLLAGEDAQNSKMAAWLRRVDRLRGAQFTFRFLQMTMGRIQESYVSQAALYLLGGLLIFLGTMTLGGLIAFIRYFAHVLRAIDKINSLNVLLGGMLAPLQRSFEVSGWMRIPPLRARLDLCEPADVDLREVSLSYEAGDPVLRGITCAIPGGSRMAIVGSSGCGKSTLARIVAGQLAPTSGDLRIGGRLLTDTGGPTALGTALLVGQDSVIYNMTIRDNLKMVRPSSTDSELRRVCADAQILSLVEELPAGLDTVIGERGRQLSNGQRQRLILARSMLIDRPILILDEATSQLDDPTARLINQKLLDPRFKGTVIVIAHRVSTIMDMPRIVVLDDGRISAEGTHQTLMRSNERYRHLFAPDE